MVYKGPNERSVERVVRVQGLAAGAPVGVLGAGAMGSGIAQVAAASGHPVLLLDVDAARAREAVTAVLAGLQTSVDKGRVDQAVHDAAATAVRACTDVADLADCGLVLEVVVEQVDVKRELLRQVERAVGPGCLITTNTSSLSIDAIAASLEEPARLVGMHFFNPAPVMRLVEVVSGLRTAPELAGQVEATALAWGKRTVRCASTPGFVVNRVARPYYSEALAVVAETGLEPAVLDQLYREAGGFRMGPLEVTDLIGHDVNYAVTESVWRALDLDARYRPSGLQRRLVEAGWLGRKTGRGFYDHGSPAPVPPRALPAAATGTVHVGPTSPLLPLLDRTSCELDEDPELGEWVRLPSGALVGLTEGELAAQAAVTAGHDVVLLDLALDWSATTRVGASASSPASLDELAAVLAGAHVAVTPLPDVPGLLLARTVALLVDEAVDLASRQRMAPADLDAAVRDGLNYPLGPLAWGDRVGAAWVVRLLDQLERLQPGGRFRVSTPLRLAAVQGRHLST
ncbi:MAG: 3-hydroxyacyl-CoA dehydrogenase [Frankiales bacterium]|nr:3-hydroxyacyl-CoA dehydrogenase [Frankiales bacterium]